MNNLSDPSRTASAEALDARFPPEPPKGLLLILKILWLAFIATQGVFAGIYALAAEDAAQQDPEAAAAMLPIFLGVSLLTAGMSLFGAPAFAARVRVDYMTMTLLRFGVAESIGLCGLVLGFMGLEVYPYAFLLASALVLLVQVPSASAYRRYRKACLGGVR